MKNAVEPSVCLHHTGHDALHLMRIVQLQLLILGYRAQRAQIVAQRIEASGGGCVVGARAACHHHARARRAAGDVTREQRAEPAQAPGNQIDPARSVGAAGARTEAAGGGHGAIRSSVPSAPAARGVESRVPHDPLCDTSRPARPVDQRLLRLARIFVEPHSERCLADIRLYEDQLRRELRIFERSRLQQSGQSGEQPVVLCVGHDELNQHLRNGCRAQQRLHDAKAFERELRIAARDIAAFERYARDRAAKPAQFAEFDRFDGRQPAQHNMTNLRAGHLVSGTQSARGRRFPHFGCQQRSARRTVERAGREPAQLDA